MKTHIKNLFLLPLLLTSFGLPLAGRLTAQTFTTLYSFTALNSSINSDGANPEAGLVLSGNTLYGTAYNGGSSGKGAIFAVNTNGTGFTPLYSFSTTSGPAATNSDGVHPLAPLVFSGNALYGTALRGGSSGNGTVFKINTDGSGFTNLHSFTATSGTPLTNTDGAVPYAGLVLSGTTLYGTTDKGGSSGNGTVFALNIDGTSFTNLYSFSATSGAFSTNSDGAFPDGQLFLSADTLYGTAAGGGSSGNGTVFALSTNGTSFTNLHSFTATSGAAFTNSDGAGPAAGPILLGSTLYGTAAGGGSSGKGTVFAVSTDGTIFTNLHSFTGTSAPYLTNSDGTYPQGGLISLGNTLYGTAYQGGSSGRGAVFALNIDGTGFATLHSFTATSGALSTNSDGAYPEAGLVSWGNTLYGAAGEGGNSAKGTVFSLLLGSVSAPQLTILPDGPNVILAWPTSSAGFTLQSTTNLVSPVVWTTNSPSPVVVNGQNTVTNPISGTQQFFRLSQ